MTVHFDTKFIMDKIEVSKELKAYYEWLISILAKDFLASELLDRVEAIFVPEDFISAVIAWQQGHEMTAPSVTNNEFCRAYGKMMFDSVTGKYSVFIDPSIAMWLMEDQLFEACFSQVDEESYLDMRQKRARSINLLAHELSHVEFATKTKRPELEHSLSGGLIQHSFILLDEYFACRRASGFAPASLADSNEQFIQGLESQIEDTKWEYKTRKIDIGAFSELFHLYTNTTLIRLVSVIGTNHGTGNNYLPFSNTKVGRYACVLSAEFSQVYDSNLSGDILDSLKKAARAIYSYYIDLGVKIEETAKGLYYHIRD